MYVPRLEHERRSEEDLRVLDELNAPRLPSVRHFVTLVFVELSRETALWRMPKNGDATSVTVRKIEHHHQLNRDRLRLHDDRFHYRR